jgi:uncharacterized membrane protein YsdA (DUF1294 family)
VSGQVAHLPEPAVLFKCSDQPHNPGFGGHGGTLSWQSNAAHSRAGTTKRGSVSSNQTVAGSLQLLSAHGLPWALASHVLASSASFGLYWTDKRSAAAERRRVPEQRLHLAALLGGWPGALVAQQVFRHKTRKASFQVVFWAIVFVHQAFWAAWLLGDGHDLTRWVPLLPG